VFRGVYITISELHIAGWAGSEPLQKQCFDECHGDQGSMRRLHASPMDTGVGRGR
jgi:hypothetical protein